MLSSIAQNVINVTDTIFLGRVGQVELGAMGLVGVFFYTFMMMGYGFSKGAQIIIARRAGEGKKKAIGWIMSNLLYFEIALSIILFAILYFLSPLILKQFVNSEPVYQACLDYLSWRNFSVFLGFIGFSMVAFFTGIGKTRIIIISTIILAVVNVCLNYTLIFGKFGFAPMGITGAGIASTIAESLAALFLFTFAFFSKELKPYKLFTFNRFNYNLVSSLFNLSIPIVIQFLIGLGGWFVFFSLIENLGEDKLAVSNIIKALYLFFGVPTWGFGSACQTIISNIIGQGQNHLVWPTTKKIALMSLLFTMAICVIIALFPEWLLSIVTDDLTLINESKPILWLLIFILLNYTLASTIFHTVSGTGAIRQSLLIEFVAVIAYLAYVYIVIFKVEGNLWQAWSSEFAYWTTLLVLSVWYIKSNKWQGLKI